MLLQQKWQHKLSTRYDCRPYTVIARQGPSVILQRGDETPIIHNVSLVHTILNEITSEEEDVDLSKGSAQEAVVVAENNGSEDGISEIGDGPNYVEVVEARNRPARQVRPPSYLRDFVRSVDTASLAGYLASQQ